VLWFSRTREYFADRFSGQVTNNPNALGRALIKIAYGLAAQHSQEAEAEDTDDKKKKTKKKELAGVGPHGALNIFDRGAAVNMVMSSAGQGAQGLGVAGGLDVERVKSAMQWDLWNPWASWYELNSTHPLVAKRLQYISDQAAALGQEPLVVFDRKPPESYWDDFLIDVFIVLLPTLGLLGGVGVFAALGLANGVWAWPLLGVALTLCGIGSLIKTYFSYRSGPFEHLTVAALLGHVKVSPVRPVLTTVTGTIIGKGVPGLIYSEDFVIRDPTGILFLDYQQPLGIWNFLFGLLRAGRYQGKEVRVSGWFRRAPVPYLQINRLEVVDGSESPRNCYTYHASFLGGFLLIALGIAATVYLSML